MFNRNELPENLRVTADLFDYRLFREQEADRGSRRLYLRGEIPSVEDDDSTSVSIDELVDKIREFNREDKTKLEADRTPIRLFIDSPGGDISAGFKLVDAITTSKTPVYTINESKCYSMAFLIFICGSKRFSTPKATFLMHDGVMFFGNSVNKAFDAADFYKRFEEKIVKGHVLQYSKMPGEEYDRLRSKEYYMMPEEAKEHGFLDEVISLNNENCSILF